MVLECISLRRCSGIARLAQAHAAPLVRAHGAAAAIAECDRRRVARGRVDGAAAAAKLPVVVGAVQGAIAAARRHSATGSRRARLGRRGSVLRVVRGAGAAAAGANGDGQALDRGPGARGASAGRGRRVHAVVDGEVAADHVGTRRGRVLGQLGRLVLNIGVVLAVVDAHHAGEALAGAECLELGLRPVAPLAEACG